MKPRILIACEESGAVRRAFRRLGFDAYSCDLLSAADGSPYHFRGDIREALKAGPWAAVIAFPPCDHLAVSGARWWKKKRRVQKAAIGFFLLFTRLHRRNGSRRVPLWAIENPIGCMSRLYRKPDQVIQPWQFGHPECKATCLWLHGLPPLTGTKNVRSAMLRRPIRLRHRIHHMAPGEDRKRERSRTFDGIAAAMAAQWGAFLK